jgi:hypothetical protein
MIHWLETAGSDALEWVDDRLPMVWTILTKAIDWWRREKEIWEQTQPPAVSVAAGAPGSPCSRRWRAERRAAIAAAQLWTQLAAIMELGLRRELEGEQYKGDEEFDAAWEARLEEFAREVPS